MDEIRMKQLETQITNYINTWNDGYTYWCEFAKRIDITKDEKEFALHEMHSAASMVNAAEIILSDVKALCRIGE